MRTYNNTVFLQFDTFSTGNSGSGKYVTVYNVGTKVKAPLFDSSLVSIGNPVSTDEEGNYTFTVDDGTYDIWIDEGLPSQNILSNEQISNTVNNPPLSPDDIVSAFTELEDAVNETSTLKAFLGSVASIRERTTGNGGGAMWDYVLASTVTTNAFNIVQCVGVPTLALVLRYSPIIDALSFGVLQSPAFMGAALQASLDSINATSGRSNIVTLSVGRIYELNTDIVIKAGVTLNCVDARVYYTGNGTAFTLGTSAKLDFAPKLLNANILTQQIDATAIKLLSTRGAKVTGRVEGEYQPFDNTRTNIAVHIDASNNSSFFNHVDVQCNHLHTSFLLQSSGTSYSTANYLVNCTSFGDHATDTTSIGISVGVTDTKPEGQGLQIIGGNVERCNEGIIVGNFSGPVTIQTRFEPGSNTTDARFMTTGQEANTIVGSSNCINVVIDNPTSSKLVRFDDKGALGRVGSGQNVTGGLILDKAGNKDGEGNFNILTDGNASSTGRVSLQAGSGSATYGAGWSAYAASHATNPGDIVVNSASGVGNFIVATGFGAGANRYIFSGSNISSADDNNRDLGSAALRWKEIFATNAVINTSDARLKTDVEALEDNYLKASKEILQALGGWKWLAKVEVEGDAARQHYGCTVQRAMAILEDNNIEPFTQSFVCYDKWDDIYSSKPLLDEGGNEILDEGGEMITETYISTYAGDRYSFRLSELTMFLLAGISARLDKAGI